MDDILESKIPDDSEVPLSEKSGIILDVETAVQISAFNSSV